MKESFELYWQNKKKRFMMCSSLEELIYRKLRHNNFSSRSLSFKEIDGYLVPHSYSSARKVRLKMDI